MAIGKKRVEKLEGVAFEELTPKDRVRLVPTAAANGDMDEAYRIGQA